MNRRRKPSRLESDALRQCLMDPDQWARYLARVRELWRQGIPIDDARSQAEREVTAK